MTKETGVPPPMYPTPSRRGGRGAGAPGTVHHQRPTPQFQQQRPAQPSSAAAKAAAAAKALHRRAQERAKTKQQQQEEEKQRTSNDNNGQSSRPPSEQRNDVFRRSPNQEITAEGQQASGGSILKKMMTTGQSYRVGPAAEDVTHEAESSSAGGRKSNIAAGAGVPPAYPPGHPGAHYQHHPHMMYGHPHPYGHHPHYPYAHPHYHHSERQNTSTHSNAKSNEDGADTSPKNTDSNHQHHYYAHNYHQGHHYPPHPYYDGRDYSSYPQYHGQNPPHPPHQYYNPYHRGSAPPPDVSSSADYAKTAESGASSKSSTAPSGPPLEEQPISNNARGSTRHVIGSHTSIHVPRASMLESNDKPGSSPEEECLPSITPRNETIFRYGEDREGRDLLESTEILLSLSKSFDRGDGIKHNHNTRGSAKKASKPKKNSKKTKKEDDAAASTPGKHSAVERPKSPDDPPRIHHFHKQTNVSTFEPQPSPLKIDPNDIELAPSFQLFNQSFDMNFENLIGPNASFGLGPMKSLSFGLGLPNPSDVGASPRASPMSIHHRMSPRVAADAAGVGNVDFGSGPAQPMLEDGVSNLQVLRASPSNSFGNVIGRSESLGNIRPKTDGSGSVIVLGDSARVGTLHAASQHQSLSPKKRNYGQMGEESATKKTKEISAERKKPPQNIDASLFEVLERHQSMFSKFSFLLPGAKPILNNPGRLMTSNYVHQSENDEEVARRRINSALCAFGGVVIPSAHSINAIKSRHEQKYEDSLPERYYEEENRLSWEIEEDPPVELDYEVDGHNANGEAKKYRCKSCGSTQHDHNCPKQSASLQLQRDIGVMVYPAVNAFTAAEPGIMTPALDEMNNFVDSPSRSTPLKEETKTCGKQDQSLPLVSPDYVKTPQRSINYAGGAWLSNHQSPVNVTPGKDTESPTDLLFVDTQELLPEQYRIVNIKKRKTSSSKYVYPALPLPYGQRKRISNAMFAMSKSIPGLTDECASVLGEARKQDAWDFAVAQLMTQVVVLTHCSAEDCRLDGLSKYLLTLGIAV